MKIWGVHDCFTKITCVYQSWTRGCVVFRAPLTIFKPQTLRDTHFDPLQLIGNHWTMQRIGRGLEHMLQSQTIGHFIFHSSYLTNCQDSDLRTFPKCANQLVSCFPCLALFIFWFWRISCGAWAQVMTPWLFIL